MFNGNISMKFYDMSHFARSNGKETVQRAHCALLGQGNTGQQCIDGGCENSHLLPTTLKLAPSL